MDYSKKKENILLPNSSNVPSMCHFKFMGEAIMFLKMQTAVIQRMNSPSLMFLKEVITNFALDR